MAEQDVVVALDYGPTRDRKRLSLAARASFSCAINYINHSTPNSYVLIGTTVERPEADMHADFGIRMRDEIIAREMKGIPSRVLFTNATSSIDEATGVKARLRKEGIDPRRIVVFCDRWHVWRARMIWEYFFPDNVVEVIAVRCMWDDSSSQPLQRRWWTWAVANFAGFVAMKVLGIERMSMFKQPV